MDFFFYLSGHLTSGARTSVFDPASVREEEGPLTRATNCSRYSLQFIYGEGKAGRPLRLEHRDSRVLLPILQAHDLFPIKTVPGEQGGKACVQPKTGFNSARINIHRLLYIYAETKNPNFNMHNLKELFESLSSNSQTVIRTFTLMKYNASISNQSAFTEEDFNRTLDKYKDTFVNSRYWYEDLSIANKSMGNLFMLSLGEAIKQYVGMFSFKDKMVWIATP